MNLDNYLEQHRAVAQEITILKKLIKDTELETQASEIALHISTLAGKMKVHLAMEDKYLYPTLSNSNDSKVQALSVQYQHEMGDLAEKFVEFKERYNTKQKLMQNKSTIVQDATHIFTLIEKRVQREEKELYHFIG